MKYSLKKLSFKLLLSNKLILFTSIFCVAISVSLIITISLFAINVDTTYKKEIHKTYGDMDLLIEYENTPNNKGVFSKIKSNNSIENISQVHVSNLKVEQLDNLVYSVGVNNDKLAQSRYRFSSSLKNNSVIMNNSLAKSLNLKIGQSITIEQKSFILTEKIEDLSTNGYVQDIIIIPYQIQKELVTKNNFINWKNDYLLVKNKKSTNNIRIANEIKNYGENVKIDVVEENPMLKNNIKSLQSYIIVFVVLILIVTSMLIISNFDILMYKMKNQFAVMRTLGSSTKQLSIVILHQSMFINTIGVLIGLLFAFFSDTYIYRIVGRFFSNDISYEQFNYPAAIVIVLMCWFIIQLFMLVPMYRIKRVLPLSIMTKVENLDFVNKKVRKIAGFLLIVVSVFLIIVSLGNSSQNALAIVLSGITFVLGLFIVFPIYLPNILNFSLPTVQKFLPAEFYIAIKNIIPQVRQNTFVILSVTVLMLLTIFGSVILNTMKVNEISYLKEKFPTPIVLSTLIEENAKINYLKVSNEVEELSTVKDVSSNSTFNLGVIQSRNKSIDVDFSLGDLHQLGQQKIIPLIDNQNFDNSIVISEELAEQYQLKENDTVQFAVYSEDGNNLNIINEKSFVIGAITNQLKGKEVYLDWNASADILKEKVTLQNVYIRTNDVEETLKQLESIKRYYPGIRINSYNEALKMAEENFYQRWAIFISVIVSISISVILGIFNAFVSNIFSKRKELAILRCLGVHPKGIRKIIQTQTVIYLFLGMIIGVVTGYLFTLIISLIDFGSLVMEYKIIALFFFSMIILDLLLFTIVAKMINKKNVILELTKDNK